MIFPFVVPTTHSKISKPSKNKKSSIVLTVLLILLFLICVTVGLYASNYSLKVSAHTLTSNKVDTPIRLAIISDLHNKSFPKNNRKLYSLIKEQNPDLILVAGDMLEKTDTAYEDTEYLKEVVGSLCGIAPVYYSIGNQERFNPRLEDIKTAVSEGGATLLEQEYTDIEVNGNPMRIGGISYYRSWDETSNAFLTEYIVSNEGGLTLLLCHNPEFYLWGIEDYPIDLTVSGHTHGGMIQLPLAGALYAPEQGWLPDYAGGFYEMEKGHLAVTTGLGSSPKFIPRVFNRPEIMIIDVI